MTLTTTFRKLRSAGACESRYKFLRKALKGVKDDEPINLLTILETNGLDDALWALNATTENCNKIARLMAADFAETALPTWRKYYPNDNRPEMAIKAARDFAHGRITDQQRAAAGSAARAAAWDAAWDANRAAAWDAGSAAWAAAWDAAGSAARDAAGSAARSAAGSAARAAAWDAGSAAWDAGSAAWAAAWDAAGSAAGAAAWAAAWDAGSAAGSAAGDAAGSAAGSAARAAAGAAAGAAAWDANREIFIKYLQPELVEVGA